MCVDAEYEVRSGRRIGLTFRAAGISGVSPPLSLSLVPSDTRQIRTAACDYGRLNARFYAESTHFYEISCILWLFSLVSHCCGPFARLCTTSALRTDRGADQAIGTINQGADQGMGKNGHLAQHCVQPPSGSAGVYLNATQRHAQGEALASPRVEAPYPGATLTLACPAGLQARS